MSTGPRPPLRAVAVLALLMIVGGLAFSIVRRRRVTTVAGPAEWPPFEPHLAPSADPVPAADPVAVGSADGWILPGPDGVPASHPIKVKVTSGIFHVPGGRFYERTSADRLYPSAESAEAAGYRPSKS
jgi:hypothetical protein